MSRSIDRRGFCSGAGALALIAAPASAPAQAPAGLDGTWGGARGALSAQVIVSGDGVIGFFWRDDYRETRAAAAAASADRRTLSFAFDGGTATLTRTGERTARLEVSDGGGVVRLDLQRD
jgi:hypothetical protein